MPTITLTERVARLERLVEELVGGSETRPTRGTTDWRSLVGIHRNDRMMRAIDEEARKIREADRRKTRPRAGRKPA